MTGQEKAAVKAFIERMIKLTEAAKLDKRI
jgi:hypothetical protein